LTKKNKSSPIKVPKIDINFERNSKLYLLTLIHLRMKSHKLLLYLLPIVLCFSLFVVSCKEEDDQVSDQKLVANYNAEAPLEWNKLFLEIERYAAGYRPGPAPRALGYMGLAAYEACVTGMPDYNSLETQFNGLNIPNIESGKEYHWPSVVHGVYSIMMPYFFTQEPPAGVRSDWDVLKNKLDQKYSAEAGTEVFNRSKAYGEAVGLAVWEWSTTMLPIMMVLVTGYLRFPAQPAQWDHSMVKYGALS
jgi:hypothetical protein